MNIWKVLEIYKVLKSLYPEILFLLRVTQPNSLLYRASFKNAIWDEDGREVQRGGDICILKAKMTAEDEMAGWHHRLNGRESEWTLGVGDGQGGLAGCSPWGCKESDTTERLNWLEATHVVVWQKPTQHAKTIILQLKIIK